MLAPLPADRWGKSSLGIQEGSKFIRQRLRSFIKIQFFSVSVAIPWSFLGFLKNISFCD